MIANYHTHTPRCGHAQGSEQEYVDAALSSGLKLLGFSDHTPYPFPDGYRSTFRMLPEELPDYVATVNGLKEKYAGQLEIHLGVEAEYYPKYFDGLLELLRLMQQFFQGKHPLFQLADPPGHRRLPRFLFAGRMTRADRKIST